MPRPEREDDPSRKSLLAKYGAALYEENKQNEQSRQNQGVSIQEKTAKSIEERTCKWAWRHSSKVFGVLEICNGDFSYYLVEQLAEILFRFTKLQANHSITYNVFVGKTPYCGCDGWKHRQQCRHVSALLALKQQGKL